jgi:voltage-gated potassium channel
VNELSQYGRLFTAFLIFFSFGTFYYAVSSITVYVVNGEFKEYFKQYRAMKEVNKLNGHIIICGYGRVGHRVTQDLIEQGYDCLVIESDPEIVQEQKDEDGFYILQGDGTNDENLREAGIMDAYGIVTCLPSDADNIYVVLSARELNKKITIVSRATLSSSMNKLKVAGADKVIMPDSIGGTHMAALIAKPDAIEFLESIKISSKNESNVETIKFTQLPENLRNKTIEELESKKITGVTIIGYRSPEGKYTINPSLETLIVPDSQLFVLGSTKQIEHFNTYYGLESE